MNTFSFRAECPVDVARFILAVDTYNAHVDDENETFIAIMNVNMRSLMLEGHPTRSFPDVTFEFESDASPEQLRNVIRTIEDSHVMLQSLRPLPLSENSLERDTEIH